MSSSSGGSEAGGSNEDVEADGAARNNHDRSEDEGSEEEEAFGDLVNAAEAADQTEEDDAVNEASTLQDEVGDEELSEAEDIPQLSRELPDSPTDALPDIAIDAGPVTPPTRSPLASPIDSGSIPDDTPSLRGSLHSSPGRGASPAGARRIAASRTVSGALKPFERRFEARPSLSPSPSSRGVSPAFLSPKSRQISLSSQISQVSSMEDGSGTDTPQAPWEVIRWTKLRKVTGQAFSEVAKRNFGRPTCLAVSALIAIGTSKGLVLGFDYHQTLKIIIGQGTKAAESGAVTTIAIAADYSTIASGHATGHIFTWEINKPAKPFLHIPPLERAMVQQPQHPDGHIDGSSILHVGFLGTRHTALVSADAGGMAFSHLATRGMGAIARIVKTTRLLGRYPTLNAEAEKTRKPSSVLAFAPLPLGNVEQATDNMGLTALLTPYLLVVVSTTPIAQTQYKASRPKEMAQHSALSGCLAWFPAVKLKSTSKGAKDKNASDTKLVYCWSNVLTVLELKAVEADDPAKPSNLEFHSRSRWRAEEAIVAVQWLGRSVLGVLTISQRLLIVEDGSLQITDSIDLLHRHIYHQDLFSKQLHVIVEQLNSADPTMHGVVADAFYMGFRAYKGRMFLLGFNDLTVGTLSNWADRLMALMEAGDHIAAIQLATEYYAGSANNVTVGLPDDDSARHRMVQERLLGMISASMNYTFPQHDGSRDARLRELAEVTFEACVRMKQTEYLFSNVFEMLEDGDEDEVFVTTLEPFILDGEITSLPPEVVKSVIAHFISENQSARLEELLCRLDPFSFDLDEITMLCRQHSLYDALIHVWTEAIGDFVTPLVDLLSLVQMLQSGGNADDLHDNPFYNASMKVFAYLAYSLTGRKYPSGELLDDNKAYRSKADLYGYLFSGKPTAWPPGSSNIFYTSIKTQDEPAFPYLVLLLDFDAASFMSMLNEAFEDPFLNAEDESFFTNGTAQQANGTRHKVHTGEGMTRQHVISIMLDVMQQPDFDFTSEQTIYLDMFVARSLPKYPQQLVLSGTLLNHVLLRLCDVPVEELRDECQLSVEYLLSAYHPPDVPALIRNLKGARFWRVLKSVYRSERMFDELLDAYFDDPQDKDAVFDCIAFCLRQSSGKQFQSVKQNIVAHAGSLADISVPLLAQTLALHAVDLLKPIINTLRSDSYQQFVFLRVLLEPSLLREEITQSSRTPVTSVLSADAQVPFIEHYVQLMCSHDPSHVADYISILPTSNLQLEQVLPAMEKSGVVDAAIILLARDGLARDAMDRLVAHMHTLQQALVGLIEAAAESPDAEATQEAAEDLVEQVQKYTMVGIWLCQGQTATTTQRTRRPRMNLAWDVKEEDLDLDEFLWLNVVDVVVQVTKNVTAALQHVDDHPAEQPHGSLDASKVTSPLRANVQQTFTVLMASTATPKIRRQEAEADLEMSTEAKVEMSTKAQTRPSQDDQQVFLRVLRAFLTRAAATAPSLTDLRAVLSDILSAYAFEQDLLSLAHGLLGSDTFNDIAKANVLRQRGWRPRTQVCDGCKRRAWGTGVGEVAWEAWMEREQGREAERARKNVERSGGEQARRLSRGKGKATNATSSTSLAQLGREGEEVDVDATDKRKLALVVFACRHVWHRVCLDGDYGSGKAPSREVYKCPLCTDRAVATTA